MTISTVNRTYYRIIAQGRLWFHFARILDAKLREQGGRLWVKPRLHAQYGLRQSAGLKTQTFILTTHLDGGKEETLEALLQQRQRSHEALRTRRARGGLVLATCDGHRLGRLCRPAWSWIGPIVEMGYEPAFFLHKIDVQGDALKAHVVIAHFHDGV
ncbi:MAG: hypothetical protein ACE5G0_01035, partial [Rhodothermales bacterium]